MTPIASDVLLLHNLEHLGGVVRHWLLVICSAVFLSACQTSAQREAARMGEQASATKETSNACFEEVRSKAQYAELRTKLHYDQTMEMPLSYLTNAARPTKKDLTDVYALHADIQRCRKVLLEGQSKIHPLIVSTQVEGFTVVDKIWAEFALGKMTWGEFNTRRRDVAADQQRLMLAAGQNIDGQLKDNHRYEVEQRQRAAQAVAAWSAQQQAINAINRPRTTNCSGFGGSVNCTTY